MTTQQYSSSIDFHNTPNAPFCYALAPQNRPGTFELYVDGEELVVFAGYPLGRGECQSPITAELRIPYNGKELDIYGATATVTREEDDIFGLGESIVTPTPLAPAMVHGLLSSYDDHVQEHTIDPASSVPLDALDAEVLRDNVFRLAVNASDLRNGGHIAGRSEISHAHMSEVPVQISSFARASR